MTKKIKAILFDMDGVLIEAKDWHFEACLNSSMNSLMNSNKSIHWRWYTHYVNQNLIMSMLSLD